MLLLHRHDRFVDGRVEFRLAGSSSATRLPLQSRFTQFLITFKPLANGRGANFQFFRDHIQGNSVLHVQPDRLPAQLDGVRPRRRRTLSTRSFR